MTQLLYYQDAYLREFDAVIAAVDGDRVALDRTAFYPGGGGQPNDDGMADDCRAALPGDGGQERGRRALA